MNKLKKTTKFKPGEYMLLKANRTVWTIFTVLDAENLLKTKNENIEYGYEGAVKEAEEAAKKHNCELTDKQRSDIRAEFDRIKWKFEDNLVYLPVADALKQGIIQKVDNGYYMPTIDYNGVGIVNKLNQAKNAKKNSKK